MYLLSWIHPILILKLFLEVKGTVFTEAWQNPVSNGALLALEILIFFPGETILLGKDSPVVLRICLLFISYALPLLSPHTFLSDALSAPARKSRIPFQSLVLSQMGTSFASLSPCSGTQPFPVSAAALLITCCRGFVALFLALHSLQVIQRPRSSFWIIYWKTPCLLRQTWAVYKLAGFVNTPRKSRLQIEAR